ncbi:hypothetical protein Tco_0742397 [Tanacetum coccineum]
MWADPTTLRTPVGAAEKPHAFGGAIQPNAPGCHGGGDDIDVDGGCCVVVSVDGSGVMAMVVLWSGGGEAVVVEWVVTVARDREW